MRKLIFAMVFGVLLLPDYGFTLGMGEIEINSALNQQLDARIELLSAAPEDAESLIIKLASREEFNRAGLDRPFTLSDLKFTPVVENGQVFIKVSTAKPVREPFLNFLIEIDWPKGHLLREYTILLDPPTFMGQPESGQPESVQGRPAVSEAAPAPAPTRPSTRSDGFRPAAVPVAAPVAAPGRQPAQAAAVTSQQQSRATSVSYTPSSGYRIQTGDTAWSLANRMRPDESVSVEQMMLAMLRSNPEVFINENVNGIKRGYILRMPGRDVINAIGQAEALATVRQQNALWREYQQALTAGQPATAMGAEGSGSTYGSGIPSGSDARLEIVSSGSGAGAAGSSKDPSKMTASELREQLALAREAVETERVEKEALKGQLGSLEQQVDRMKSLISIEDDSLAEIQAVGQSEVVAAMPGEEGLPGDEVIADEEAAAMAALDALTGETAPEMNAEMTEAAEGEAIFVDEQPEQEMVEVAPSEEMRSDRAQPVPMPREEQGLVASLLKSPLLVGGVAVGVLILLGVIYILVKRRRDAAASEVEAMLAADSGFDMDTDLDYVADMVGDDAVDKMVSDEEVEASMAEAEAEAEPDDEFDAEATMILPSDDDTVVSKAASSKDTAEEDRDDVIAEADVYLAYGIYQQAEDLLNTALAENPDKDAYRVKLAETYYASKNAKDMSKLGAEMKQRLGGEETSAWRKVVAMGKELCPDDEIFRQAGMAPNLDLDDLMPKSPEPMDFDLGEATGEIESSDLNFDLETETGDTDLEMPALDDTSGLALDDMPAAKATDELGDLEFDLSETEAISEPAAELPKKAEEFSLDIEASELDIEEDISFKKSEPETGTDEMEMEADVGDMDFDMDLGETTSADVDDITVASLDDVSLDELGAELDELADESEPPAASFEAHVSDEDEMDLSDLSDVDEISTKLDLARAYLDMGDHEGARDIIDEVLMDGNDQQKQEAEELLKDLG